MILAVVLSAAAVVLAIVLTGRKFMDKLDDLITQLQADDAALKLFIAAKAAELADVRAQLTAALEAGKAPTQTQLDALAALHSDLSAIVNRPTAAAPPPVEEPPAPAGGVS